jgi:hypothetical protein
MQARLPRPRWRCLARCSQPGRMCTRSAGRTRARGRPAVRGGWRKGTPHAERDYLPLTPEVLTAHLSGQAHIGLYPLLDGDQCWWLAADFDGPAAMLDALAYLKAARSLGVPAALEVSRSGIGAHAWVFFTGPVPAQTARRLGTGLLREAMALRGQMDLASYDRLFPSQDVLPAGGMGNLIAAPLHGRSRRDGATVFLDLATLEPHEDQWAFLSTLGRVSPREVTRAADKAARITTGAEVSRIGQPVSTRTRPAPSSVIQVRLGAGVRLEQGQLTPALLATLKHAASMPNPLFYERQRLRGGVRWRDWLRGSSKGRPACLPSRSAGTAALLWHCSPSHCHRVLAAAARDVMR